MHLTDLFAENFKDSELLFNEPMSKHTSFKIGGPADLIIFPENIEEIKLAARLCIENNIPYVVIGKGSNLIVSDFGFKGVIISLSKNFEHIQYESDSIIKASSGISLAKLATFAMENSLAGLEFASGIPGTLGGGISMNAGAYDGEMKNVVTSVTLLNENCELVCFNTDEMGFGYRTSVVQSKPYIILEAIFTLKHGDKRAIAEKMKTLNAMRKEKQPLEYPSAGSIFRRPKGYFAAKLIDDAGLKGYAIGGAEVSSKHCGFIVNANNATANDVLQLIDHVKMVVYDKFNVELVPEVKIIGD